jgi:hypothetical protein
MFILLIISIILIFLPLMCFIKKINSNIKNLFTLTVKKNSVNKINNLPQHKVAKGIYRLNIYFNIIMFSMLLLFSFSIYSSDLLTFVVVGQTELIFIYNLYSIIFEF